jgi:hypothetical protein
VPPGSGFFDLSWHVLCPGCGGVLEAGADIPSLHAQQRQQHDRFARELGFLTYFDGTSYGELPTAPHDAFGNLNFG